MDLVNKKLLNVKELKEYTGWGDTTVRRCPFTVRMGNRLYADKDLFDKYIADCIKYQINVC